MEQTGQRGSAHPNYLSTYLQDLEKLRGFLLLSDYDVDGVHVPLARDEFLGLLKQEFERQKKAAAATEGMVSTTPVSTAGVERVMSLSRKLGLSESARDDLMGEAMTSYLEPMLNGLRTNYRRVTTPPAELAKETGKDEGEDPFIKAR
jgi:hypothetical protein